MIKATIRIIALSLLAIITMLVSLPLAMITEWKSFDGFIDDLNDISDGYFDSIVEIQDDQNNDN